MLPTSWPTDVAKTSFREPHARAVRQIERRRPKLRSLDIEGTHIHILQQSIEKTTVEADESVACLTYSNQMPEAPGRGQ